MVSDTRSSRHIKDDLDDGSSKKKLIDGKVLSHCSSGKADALGVRRFARETSSSRPANPSPEGERKSKRLKKGTPPLTPLVKRKSERLEKQNKPSPLRRSDRGKKNISSSSSGSQHSAKELKLLNPKRKNEKNWIKANTDSEKTKLDMDSVCLKKKRMNAYDFKELFHQIREILPDVDVELEGPNKLSRTCGDDGRGVGSEPIGKGEDISDERRRRRVGKWRDESIHNVSGGALPKTGSSLKDSAADKLERGINVDSKYLNNVVNESPEAPDGGGIKDSKTCSSIREIFHDPETLSINCSSLNNMHASESERSSCLERLKNVVINSGSGEKCMSPKSMAYAMDTNFDLTVTNAGKREDHNLQGTCVLCSKKKRIAYDSPEQELCSCGDTADEDVGNFSACEDKNDHGVSVDLEYAEKCVHRNPLKKTHPLGQMDVHDNVCAMCNKVGELLCCVGKGCNRCFHLCCLDPPLTDLLPGVWHCSRCVEKKLVLGVHSVTEGVESIWDVREVEVSNSKGMPKQKQYLVKYQGLAHIYNHWVSKKHLFIENPCVVSDYVAKDQIVKWNAKWTVPHRLLRRRSVQYKYHTASSVDISDCHYEWLVKWHDLSYDQATWELDSAYFLRSALGLNLVKNYKIRRTMSMKRVDKHPKESFVNISELPTSGWPVKNNHLLNNVNKLRECWFKSQNAVVFDNQERTMAVIFFIKSMTELCNPFLIVAASDSLCQWEGEFARLAPSVDVVVYSGSKDTRKVIRASEFYEEGGCVMLQVLLSSHEAVSEDLDALRCITWEGIIIDEYHHWKISNDLGQIKMLATDLKILLVSDQIKDTTSEYLNMLSLLDTHGDFDKPRSQKSETNDNLGKLKERLSSFVAYRRTSEASKFLEYWVPAQISNHQLEQYCAALLSNSTSLCSCLRNDPFVALQDTLLTVRKCCDHPYLVDSSVQERLIAEERPAAEVLDIVIKASGKLQLLDTMLTEIKTRGLKVLILYQSILGSGGVSTGDILDDFLHQRFGQNTYERVDDRVPLPKKQAAVNRFNKKETGEFVFLLENGACSLTIKLLPIDIIVIYDSNWNPANDLRALQKISVDFKLEQIKIFRLYSSHTVEERALVLAKKNVNLDNNFQTLGRATCDTLLMWGASYLFKKLDDYHVSSNATTALNISSEQSLLNEVTKEFQAILSESCESNDLNSVISKATLDIGSYSMNIPVLGEREIQLKDGEEPYVFWRNLLDRKIPCWKHLRRSCSQHRNRVQYLDRSPVTENDDKGRKRVRMVNDTVNPAKVQLKFVEVTQVTGFKEGGPLIIKDSYPSQHLQTHIATSSSNPNSKCGHSSCSPEVDVHESDESLDELESLHSFLKRETTKLCQILKLSEDVMAMVRKFLVYVIKNHKVSTDSPAYVQALQISLCWIAASILKQKVYKKDSLMLSRQLLNYQCTEEQANSVYAKMRSLKKIYLHCSENFIVPGKKCLLAEEDICEEPSSINETGLHFSSFKLPNLKRENEEGSANEQHAEDRTLSRQKMAMNDKAAISEIENKIEKIKRKCEKRMKKLIRKQQEEIQEFHQIWEEKGKELQTDHRLKSAVIRSIHGQCSVRIGKLKLLTDNFEKKMEEHNLVMDVDLKDLESKQLNARNEEREKATHWLAEVRAFTSELKSFNRSQPHGFQFEEAAVCSLSSTPIAINSSIDVVPLYRLQTEDQSPSKSNVVHGNDAALSNTCISAPAAAVCSSAPVDTLSDLGAFNLQSKMPILFLERSLAVIEQPNQSNLSNTDEIASVNLPASGEQIYDEYQSANLSKEISKVVPETVPNEVVGDVYFLPLDDASNKEYDNGDAIGKSAVVHGNDVALSNACISAPAAAVCSSAPVDTLGDLGAFNLQSKMPVLFLERSLAVIEQPNQSKQSNTDEIASVNLPASGEQISDEYQPANLSKEISKIVPETVPNEVVRDVYCLPLDDASNKEYDNGDAIGKSAVVHGNDVALSNACISAPAAAECSSAPVDTLGDLGAFNLQRKMPVLFLERSLAVIEQPNQSKLSNTDEIASVNLPASGEQISDEYQPANPSKEISKVVPETVPNEVVRDVYCLPLDDASNKEYDNGDAIGLFDNDNPGNGPDEANIGDLPFPGRQLVLSEQIVAFPDYCGSLAQQAPQGKIPQSLMSSELHEQDAPVVENQSTWQIGVSASVVDNVTPVQSNHEASITENSKLLHHVPVDVSLCCNQSPVFEVAYKNNDHGRSSFQTPEAGESRMHLDEPVSQGEENLELHENYLVLGSANSAAGLQNQAGLHVGIDADYLHGPSYVFAHPTHQISTGNSTPSLFAEPLQNELKRMQKESEQMEKSHQDMMSQLKSDSEKKIQEIITHIRHECDVKLKEAEAKFKLKKNEFDKNQTKILMNKMLAEAFRSKFLDFGPSGLPGMQQGIPPNLMQHLHQLSLPPSVRPSPGGASPCQPIPNLQAATQATLVNQAMQQLSSSQSMRPSPVASQNFTVPPVQAVQHAPVLFSSTPSKAPVISAITPSGNPRIGGEIRSPAPHLQSFRPASASSMPSITPSKPQYPPQQILNNRPFELPPP